MPIDSLKTTCGTSLKHDDPFGAGRLCPNVGNRSGRRQASANRTSNQTLEESLRIAQLQQQVGQLEKTLMRLMSLIEPEEIAAHFRLRQLIPTNAQLKVWADESELPEHMDEPEKRPW